MGYQMHLSHQGCGSIVWAHYVSADFLHWARLPPSIWSGGATAGGFKYDNVSIYSGSATVGPGGIPRMVYPGMCAGNCAHGHMTPPTDCYPLCKTGFTYGLVVPANLSDPLYSVWKKPDYNPIVNSTGLDPSGAWQTASGEWRFVGNGRAEATGCPGNATTETTPIYGSKDFVSWYKVGCTTLPAGDCPTLFPRPALTPGSTDGMSAAEIAALPTHVYKAGLFAPGNYDTCWFGDLKDGSPGREGVGSVGSWVRCTWPLHLVQASAVLFAAGRYRRARRRTSLWPAPRTRPKTSGILGSSAGSSGCGRRSGRGRKQCRGR